MSGTTRSSKRLRGVSPHASPQEEEAAAQSAQANEAGGSMADRIEWRVKRQAKTEDLRTNLLATVKDANDSNTTPTEATVRVIIASAGRFNVMCERDENLTTELASEWNCICAAQLDGGTPTAEQQTQFNFFFIEGVRKLVRMEGKEFAEEAVGIDAVAAALDAEAKEVAADAPAAQPLQPEEVLDVAAVEGAFGAAEEATMAAEEALDESMDGLDEASALRQGLADCLAKLQEQDALLAELIPARNALSRKLQQLEALVNKAPPTPHQ